ncbi:MAG: carboxypeptidase-like regulatory domain-containing protein [Actinomycetota bacterium]|nr:carboxypeptidase-like regulatory domain-containing protein [Actinomycetota bacterium]
MRSKVSGTVLVHDRPAPGATVELHNSSGDVVTQIMVDDDGKFAFHVSEGSWSLNAWDAHGHRGSAPVTLAEGEEKSIDLVLEHPEGGH